MKKIGNIGEISFMARCMRHGLEVSMPFCSSSVYDVLVDNGNKINRCQVKSTGTTFRGSDSYKIIASHGAKTKRRYTKSEIDFIICYIVGLDIYYIIPIKEIKTKTLNLYPTKINHKYNKYMNYFDLLK